MGTSLKPAHIDLPVPPRPNPRPDPTPMSRPMPDPNHADCRGVASVLSRVGDKWSVFVIMMLSDGPKRFNELKRMINGISQRMLTLTLRGLERDGLVTRTIFPTIPPRVDYELTDLGRGLQQPVKALGEWAIAHLEQIEAARTRFDQRKEG
ncbi:winged helix-turn-helix transcriptional regulator [Bradyrhizobium yuanmingense]|uniref:winged helix-turn-helix transcriptional regulator n=1 Tax=Bradyrhizobium yuanmingense TaxID=108015 RepID=UPI0023B8A5BE|nr:helix-turn-helix domain-containing protein [Bradyrhizobium yuanmingense]MDF0581852.1 helix-turn-helix domain-containing protein [Bradyrhizobium yuanmingense]